MAQTRSDLQKAFSDLVGADADADRRQAAEALIAAVNLYLASDEGVGETPDVDKAAASTRKAFAGRTPPISQFSDDEMAHLNALLPWAAMTADDRGRVLGRPWSATKRAKVHAFTEKRIRAFDDVYPLAGRHVAEFGCFEGIYTLAMILRGAQVTAIDGRVENVLKTLARLWAYGETADVVLWNVEHAVPAAMPADWDVLHHFGVLYHLSDPIGHLDEILPRTRGALLLDTHVVDEADQASLTYQVGGRDVRYRMKPEPNAAKAPFAGMKDHAKYLVLEDLIDHIAAHGFTDVRVVSDRMERHGRRVTVWAFRQAP